MELIATGSSLIFISSLADTLADRGPALSPQRINGISLTKPSTFWTNYSVTIIKNVSRLVKPKRSHTLVRTELYQETRAKLVYKILFGPIHHRTQQMGKAIHRHNSIALPTVPVSIYIDSKTSLPFYHSSRQTVCGGAPGQWCFSLRIRSTSQSSSFTGRQRMQYLILISARIGNGARVEQFFFFQHFCRYNNHPSLLVSVRQGH